MKTAPIAHSVRKSPDALWPVTRVLWVQCSDNSPWRDLQPHLAVVGDEIQLLWEKVRVKEALDALTRFRPAICLIDCGSGEATALKSGLDFLGRATGQGEKATFILLGVPDDFSLEEALSLGANDCLSQSELDISSVRRTLRYAIRQQKADEKLRDLSHRTELLDVAVSHTNVGLIITQTLNADSAITFVNRAFEEITGYRADEVLGLNPRFLQGEQTEPEKIEAMRDAIERGVTFDDTILNYRKDGTAFKNSMRISPVRQQNGEITAWVSYLNDVTERQHIEALARESQHRLRSVMENAPLLIWSIDSRGIINFVEGRALQTTRTRPEDLIGRPIADFARLNPSVVTMANQALSGQEADGILHLGHFVFDTHYSSVRDEQGNVVGAVGIATDVTARAQAERAFLQSEEQLETVLAAVPILIWAIDENGIFTLSRGQALGRLGLKQGEAVGQSLFDMYGHDNPIADMARRALQGEVLDATLEVGSFVFDVHAVPIWDSNGRVVGVVGASSDVTERVHAQRELNESEARFARVVANVPGMVYRFHLTRNGEMNFWYVSKGCREIYGVEPEEVLQNAQTLLEIVHSEDRASFFSSVSASEQDLSPWIWEGRILHRDGEVHWIRGQARPARQSDGSTVWDGLVIDITQSHNAQDELNRSRRALDEAQKLAHVGSFKWNLLTGKVIWSDEMFRLLGYAPQSFEPTHESLLEFIIPHEREKMRGQPPEVMALSIPASTVVVAEDANGNRRIFQTYSSPETDTNGHVIRLVGSVQDVTETIESQQALLESEQRYALAAQGANDGLWDWNLESNSIYLSPRWKMMLGYAVDEISDDPQEWFSRVADDDTERLNVTLEQHLQGHTSHFECEYRLRCADGTFRWMLGRGMTVFRSDGVASRIAGSQTDITERKQAEAQLSHNAFYDTLTELPNRALFLDRLDRTLSRARRNAEYRYAVLFLDIDRFKKINDSLGHLAGDQLLIQAASRFETCLRPGDTVTRLGGDEFAVLIDDIKDLNDVNLVAVRIQKELEPPFVLDGKEVFVTVSIGVAPSSGGQEPPDELLRQADTAMYRAKALGRARHEVFDSTMHQRAVQMLELETDLWRAIERNELRLHYQPIIALDTGLICGYEALVRWQHPQLGLVPPGDFIPLAEENGLILPIGWWILEEACRQAKAWDDFFAHQPTHFMAINLSSQQFSQADAVDKIVKTVQQSGFEPNHIKLEITESVIMENTEMASAQLQQLTSFGIRLSMDDFGTGYSSLSYLHRFPLDTLKIDRSFIAQMGVHDTKHEIVGTIMSLAKSLQMNVVAEGVENTEQLATLRALGCGQAQGYLFSKPLPADEVERLLHQKPRW